MGAIPSEIAADYEEFRVSGTFDGHLFHIQLSLVKVLSGGFDAGLHVLWFPEPYTIDIPWGKGSAHSGSADLMITNDEGELAGGGASASLDGYLQLLLKREGSH